MSTAPVKVTVTAEDVAQGELCHPFLCPVGRAVGRAFPNYYASVTSFGVRVGRRTINDPPADPERYTLPPDVWEAIKHYDNTGQMEPREFEITPVPPDPAPGEENP